MDERYHYRIRIKGQLGPQWSDWFAGMSVTLDAYGDTLLTGPVIDQAALFGLLRRVRDVGLPLLSVTRIATPQDEPPAAPESPTSSYLR